MSVFVLPKVGDEIKVSLTLKVVNVDSSDQPVECAFVDLGVDIDGEYESTRWYTRKHWDALMCLSDPEYKRKQVITQIEELQKTLAELDNVKGEVNE